MSFINTYIYMVQLQTDVDVRQA